jgi:hypothetical protein
VPEQVTSARPAGLVRALLLPVLIAETGLVSDGLRVREIDDAEGGRLVRIVRRGSGPVVTLRRAQMALWAGRPGLAHGRGLVRR